MWDFKWTNSRFMKRHLEDIPDLPDHPGVGQVVQWLYYNSTFVPRIPKIYNTHFFYVF